MSIIFNALKGTWRGNYESFVTDFCLLVLSVIVGLVLGEGAAAPVKTWIAPIGTMFINLIKMMIVPVVFCSLVVGMTSMGI